MSSNYTHRHMRCQKHTPLSDLMCVCVVLLTCSCSPLLMESSLLFRAVKSKMALMKLAGNSSELQTHSVTHMLYSCRSYVCLMCWYACICTCSQAPAVVCCSTQTNRVLKQLNDRLIMWSCVWYVCTICCVTGARAGSRLLVLMFVFVFVFTFPFLTLGSGFLISGGSHPSSNTGV